MSAADTDELARALRQWRERIEPADVGLPAGTRRRTPGLRREEVAGLAGVSVDYVTRLEQGRGSHPSPSILTALARALRLTDAETAHLYALAGEPRPGPGTIRDTVRPSVLRLMDRMADLPVMVVNARKDVVAWNAMAAALLGDLSSIPAAHRNLAWLRFHEDPTLARHPESEQERLDEAAVADLRIAAARYPDDERLARLVADLRAASPTFAHLWEARPVEPRHTDRKSYEHPRVGLITLDCDPLAVPGDDQTMIVYSAAPGSPEADALALLRVLGTQTIDA